jgi:hypothetical protein
MTLSIITQNKTITLQSQHPQLYLQYNYLEVTPAIVPNPSILNSGLSVPLASISSSFIAFTNIIINSDFAYPKVYGIFRNSLSLIFA